MSRRAKYMACEIDEWIVKLLASYIPQGGAANAVAEAERRRAAGEIVVFFLTTTGQILVGPPMDVTD